MTKSLANMLYLKQKLYTLKMTIGKLLEDHLDDFNKIILDLENIEITLEDEDQTLLLLRSLPNEFDNLSNTLIYGKDTLSLEEVHATLFTKELRRKLESKGDQDAKGSFTRGRPEKKEFKGKKGTRSKSKEGKKRRCFICGSEENFKKNVLSTRRKRNKEIKTITVVMQTLAQKGMKVLMSCVFQRHQSNQIGFLTRVAHFTCVL